VALELHVVIAPRLPPDVGETARVGSQRQRDDTLERKQRDDEPE
jgi:hypothetical protein